MNIYIIGADRRNKKNVETYQKVAEVLKNSGHTVDRTWIDTTTEEDASNFESAFKRNMTSIKKADIIVAEVTELTTGIGFLLSAALHVKKPVLALFNKDSGVTPSTTIKGSVATNKLLSYREYTFEILTEVLNDFFSEIKKKLDTKFILIISPDIDKYLEWSSDQKRMHKAQIVRQAVEKTMEDDQEWEEYKKAEGL